MHWSPNLLVPKVPRMFTSTAGVTPCDFKTVARVCRLLCSPCTTSLADWASLENWIDDPDEGRLPLGEEGEGFWLPVEVEGVLLPPKLICPLIVENRKSRSRRGLAFAISLQDTRCCGQAVSGGKQVSTASTMLAGLTDCGCSSGSLAGRSTLLGIPINHTAGRIPRRHLGEENSLLSQSPHTGKYHQHYG